MDGFLPDYKICSYCKKKKSQEEFGLDISTKSGLRCQCKTCVSKTAPNIQRQLNFGISEVQYELMLKSQDGVCAICGQPETVKQNNKTQTQMLSVDHNHKTHKVRGLLCSRCNLGLGFLKTKKLLQAAIAYLEKTNEDHRNCL